jgi:FlaA1/EpsC-like NDP-sugar epimerase
MNFRDEAVQERLLGRARREVLEPADREIYRGQRVAITGAGGSIGSELARQLAACAPATLALFDHSEYFLFRIERELRERFPDVSLEPILGDVTRRRSVRAMVSAARPDVIFHAAAYKHVTMMERAVCAAIHVNAFGTLNVLDEARAAGSRFVLISSDKAANPRSVMGATKRLAEILTLSRSSARLRPVVVRFGNVLASSGSFVEIMAECIREGRPIPVTDADAERYFMTTREAVSLVLKADHVSRGGQICWLDMGEPVRIGDLVERTLALAEEAGYRRPRTEHVGLRPGEKRHEELLTPGVALVATPHPRVWIAREPAWSVDGLRAPIRALRRAVSRQDGAAALMALCAVVPEYQFSAAAWTAAAAASEAARRAAEPIVHQEIAVPAQVATFPISTIARPRERHPAPTAGRIGTERGARRVSQGR